MPINGTSAMGQLALKALQDPQAFAQLIAQHGIDIGQYSQAGTTPAAQTPIPVAPQQPVAVPGTAPGTVPGQPSAAPGNATVDALAKVGQVVKPAPTATPNFQLPTGAGPIQRSAGGPDPQLLAQLIGLLAPSAAPNVTSLGSLISGR